MKIIKILLILLISIVSFGQNNIDELSKGMAEYSAGNFSAAYNHFLSISADSETDRLSAATAAFYKGECLWNMKQESAALSEYENFLNKYSLSNFRHIALYRLGTIYFQKGEYRKCRYNLQTLINDYPEHPFAAQSFYWMGEASISEENYIKAEEYLKEAISRRTVNRYIDYSIFALAGVYEKRNDYENAALYYDELLSYYKYSDLAPLAQLRIGICYFLLNDYDRAIIELSDPAIESLPQKEGSEAHFILANSFFRLSEYKNASEIFQTIIDKYPQNQENEKIWFALALVNFQLGHYDEAFRIFRYMKNSAVDSIASNSIYWSAECKRYSGDTGGALEIYKNFLINSPDDKLAPAVNFKIGVIYYNRGDIPGAESYLNASLNSEDHVTRGKAFTLLGEISLMNDDLINGESYFSSAIQIESLPVTDLNRAFLGLGVAYYHRGNYEKAAATLLNLNFNHKSFEKDKVNLYLAESLFKTGDYKSAMKHFSRVSPDDSLLFSEALYGRAYSHFNLSDYANSAFYFNEFINRFPGNKRETDARLRLADSYFGAKNYARASEIYNDLFSTSSKKIRDDFAWYQYGMTMFKAGQNKSAIDIFGELQRRFPSSRYADDSQYMRGWINFQDGNYDRAVSEYRQVLKNYPLSQLEPIIYYSIGDAFYNTARYDSSVANYMRIIYYFPKTEYVFDALNGIQYSYLAQNDPAAAAAVIDRYITDNPTSPFGDEVLFKKGEIFYSFGDYKKAQTGYKDFIATYPESRFIPNAYYWIGKCADNLGETESAIYNFRMVTSGYLSTDAGISSSVELANIYNERSEFSEALNLVNEVLAVAEASEREAELLLLKADTEIAAEMKNDAYKTLEKLVNYFDGTIFGAKAKIKISVMQMDDGVYDEAARLLAEVSENRIDDIGAEAQYYYGELLFRKGETKNAITSFVRVRTVFAQFENWYAKSLIRLGDCYKKLRDRKQAREMYRAVIRKHKNDELGKEAKRKLGRL